MANRQRLRNQIIRAWHDTICEAYSQRLINSERGLQVHFCMRLMGEFQAFSGPGNSTNRLLFVEPTFRDPVTQHACMPDVVVCHTRMIIGIIELKFRPKGIAETEKDLGTLTKFFSPHQDLRLENKRFSGPDDARSPVFSVAPDALLCWAAIQKRSDAGEHLDQSAEHLGDRFLALHAFTSTGAIPEIYPERPAHE